MANETSPRVSDQAFKLIEALDSELNKKIGWDENAIRRFVGDLLAHGRVEVGWREACGKTDITQTSYRAWIKALKQLRKDGLEISEKRIKHGNGYATMKGGFWNSIIYTLQPPTIS